VIFPATAVALVDKSKLVKNLGTFPLPVEVLERSRSFVARELVKLGGAPVLRLGFVTDHGNQILDVHDLQISNPTELEQKINLIPGVVDNGIFAHHKPSKIIIGKN
jgi:ribose 5-phosphate isomerase A